jgi:hypothetical protein
MFSEHQPQIGAYAMASPEGLAHVATFVLATIRTRFMRVAEMMAQQDFSCCTPASRAGIEYVQANMASLHVMATKALTLKGSQKRAQALIRAFLVIPGIGIVKAGFIAQLVGGVAGCIDVHNAKLYGINLDAFSVQKGLSEKVVNLKIAHYVRMCHQLGTGYLWDNWCHHLSAKYPTIWPEAQDVSRYHLSCLNLA